MQTKNKQPNAARKTVGFLRKAGMGLVIGIASITPGLSGGVIAAAAGLYEPAVHAIVNARKQFRQSVFFLLPLALGAGVGVLLFSNLMKMLMAAASATVLFVFLGLVAGSFPALVKEANTGGFQPRYLWAAAAAFGFVLFIENLVAHVIAPAGLTLNVPTTIFCGAILAFGTVLPGISSSFLLIQLGVYEGLLNAITGLELGVLALFAAGFGAAALVLVWLADRLFRRFRGYAYYAVIGFLLGSVVLVFPGFRGGWGLLLDLVLFAASAVACYFVMRASPEKPRETPQA